jgi:uncharacterized protein YjiK
VNTRRSPLYWRVFTLGFKGFLHPSGLCLRFVVVCMALGLASCKGHQPSTVSTSQNLRLINTYTVAVPEPSGLTLSKDGRSLWTVSDRDDGIYQIDLQGKVLRHFSVEYEDLEGVTTIDDSHLAFISERANKIVVARKDGTILRERTIAISGSSNKGLESVSYDEDTALFYVLQERPGILITLNDQLEEVGRREIKFAQDYSSISFDSARQQLWVLSDLSKSIHVLDLDLRVQESFSVDVKQMEGLTIDHEAHLIYLISDSLSRLYIFEFDQF